MLVTFIFHKTSTGAQRIFCDKEFQHVDVAIYDGRDHMLFRFDHTGIHTRRIEHGTVKQFLRCIRSINDVSAVVNISIEKRAKYRWTPLWIKSCNRIVTEISGIDIGFTLNPSHLYNKLLKLDRMSNYEVLYAWRRDDGRQRPEFNRRQVTTTDRSAEC